MGRVIFQCPVGNAHGNMWRNLPEEQILTEIDTPPMARRGGSKGILILAFITSNLYCNGDGLSWTSPVWDSYLQVATFMHIVNSYSI